MENLISQNSKQVMNSIGNSQERVRPENCVEVVTEHEWEKYCIKHKQDLTSYDKLNKNFYWPEEPPVYNDEKLSFINQRFAIDTVVTHTAPDFCELMSKNGLRAYAAIDKELQKDVEEERTSMTILYNRLVHDAHPLTHWYYGHFHQSWHSTIAGVLFKMLDIMEFSPVNY